jgi:hypothetical protein
MLGLSVISRAMSKRNRRRLVRFNWRCAQALARQRRLVESYRADEMRMAPSAPWSALAFMIAAAGYAFAATLLFIVEQKALALAATVVFWLLLVLALARWDDHRGRRLARDQARGETAKQEALLRELEATQARRRHALVAALGLDQSAI